jgi:uncharacterized protein (DUF1697 family)
MKDLTDVFVEAGCANVRTYIQSGNVVFTAAPRVIAKVPHLVAAQIAKRFGYRTPVVLRTAEELSDVLSNNPFIAASTPEDYLHVMFLADLPDPGDVEKLDPARSPGDFFAVRGRDIYLRLPNGAAKTKLSNAYFDSKLRTVSTCRNWRTTGKLLEMMKS